LIFKFEKLGLGGTFDRLHAGHKLILDLAAYYSDFIQIGLISEKYLLNRPKILGKHIQPFKKRSLSLLQYLKSRNKTCSIVTIDTLGKDKQIASKSDLHALLVSQETYSGAITINHERKALKKPSLAIVLSAIVTTNKGKKLSSSKIREDLFEKKS
jgi:pantetheine-phosphate adenylyltransferase